MAFSYQYTEQSLDHAVVPAILPAVFDLPVDGAAEVTFEIPAGAWEVRADIVNPGDLVSGAVLKWRDSSGTLREFDPSLGLNFPFRELKAGVLAYPATTIVFPLGAIGAVSVLGPSGMSAPTSS